MKYRKNNFLLTLLLVTLLWQSADCMPKNIKGTDSVVADEYKHLSLVNGAIIWETGVIRRMYDYGNITPIIKKVKTTGRDQIIGFEDDYDGTVRLIHALFYRIPNMPGESSFLETKNFKDGVDAKKIIESIANVLIICEKLEASYPDFKEAVELMIEKSTNSEKTRSLFNSILSAPWNQQQLGVLESSYSQKPAESDDLKNAKQSLSSIQKQLKGKPTDKQKDKIVELKHQIKVLEDTAKAEGSGRTLPADILKIKNYCQLLGSISKTFDEIMAAGGATKGTYGEFFHKSLRAFDEKNPDALYPPHITQAVLLGFIYKSYSEDRSLLHYFYEQLNNGLDKKFLVDNKNIDPNDSYPDSMNADDALKVVIDVTKKLPVSPNSYLADFLYYPMFVRALPKPLNDATIRYEYKPGIFTPSMPNCMENTLHNLFNLLSYNPATVKFDLNILAHRMNKFVDNGTIKTESFNKDLIAFFEKFSSLNTAGSIAAHEAWLRIISNIPYIAYMRNIDGTSGKVTYSKDAGYIRLSTHDALPQELEDFVRSKNYEVLGADEYGYELMPSIRNLIVLFNHLLNLGLFDHEPLEKAFIRQDFIKEYFPKLCTTLNVTGYQTQDENGKEHDTQINFDEQDYLMVVNYAVWRVPYTSKEDFSCIIGTQNQVHGSVDLLSSVGEKNEEELFEIVENVPGKIAESLGLVLCSNILNRNMVSLSSITHAPKLTDKHLLIFSLPLEHEANFNGILNFVSKQSPALNPVLNREICHVLLKMALNLPESRRTEALTNVFEKLGVYIESKYHIERAVADAYKSVQSTNKNHQLQGLKLFNVLVNKRQGFQQAATAASDAIRSPDKNIQVSGFDLFNTLFEKNQGYEQAATAASDAIKNANLDMRNLGLDLFKALFEKNQGSEQAATAASDAIMSPDKNIRNLGVNLFKALFEKNQGYEQAATAASEALKLPDLDMQILAIDLFKTLLERGQGLHQAIISASDAIKTTRSVAAGRRLFTTLVENGQGYELAATAASDAIMSTGGLARNWGSKIFKVLFEKGQGFQQGAAAASEAIKSTDTKLQVLALELFNTLVEKGQAYELAATAADMALKSPDKQIKLIGSQLNNRLQKARTTAPTVKKGAESAT